MPLTQLQIAATIAHNLRLLRTETRRTQAETAERLNLARSLYECYENGRAFPKMEIILKVCDLYSVDLEKFVRVRFERAEVA